MRDNQKSAVYSAEQQLRWVYDVSKGGTAEVGGVALQLESETQFTSLKDIQAYLDLVHVHPGVIARFGQFGRVFIRERKGDRFAHYSNGVIAINSAGRGWGMRELVVIHELAHHYSPARGHGPQFTDTFVTLLEILVGSQAALAMHILQRESGAK
jgi:putative metallohydrolase (TIGR04338 family)